MSDRVMFRSRQYVVASVGVLSVLGVVSAGAFLDPRTLATRGPGWMFWLWEGLILGLLVRASFVGVLVNGEIVTRRGWFRSQRWPVQDAIGVGSSNYSGMYNWFSRSSQFVMPTIQTRDGAVIEIPELTGTPHAVDDLSTRLRARLRLPRATLPGRHRDHI